METLSTNRAVGGTQGVHRHASTATKTLMTFSVFASLCVLTACQTTETPAAKSSVCAAFDAWIDARANGGMATPVSLDLSQDVIDPRDAKLKGKLGAVQGYDRYAALETCLTGRVGTYDFERQGAPITVSDTRPGALVQLDYDPARKVTTIFLTPTGTAN